MLNISFNSIKQFVSTEKFDAFAKAEAIQINQPVLRAGFILMVIGLITLFLPWTQNIQSEGVVTARHPEQRPQSIQSLISGRIEKWYVNEGERVSKGDTILYISEVKEDYFDPQLVQRTQEQVQAKSQSVEFYGQKAVNLRNQINNLYQLQNLKNEQAKNKLQQAELKVLTDSIELIAVENNLGIAQNQLKRTQELYDQGLKPLIDLEDKRLKNQDMLAKTLAQQNKLIQSRNEVLNARLELTSTLADYREKIAKAEAELSSTISTQFDASANLSKLRISYDNYVIRSGYYYVLAPQSGYIAKAITTGLGELIKEGEALVQIIPESPELAIEMFIRPVDLPLINIDQEVRIQFDGWPVIVFSGWPNLSFGTYAGKVVAIDRFINEQGYYRVLVAQAEPWPELLRMGGGAYTMTLCNNVQVWYEIWRRINGFPPDFYQINNQAAKPKK